MKKGRTINFIGECARTHAMISHVIQNSPGVGQIFCAPGNAGIASERLKNGGMVNCVLIAVDAVHSHLDLAREKAADATIVSPELPLALEVGDMFEQAGIKLFGCNGKAAQFEASKCFAQKFAKKYRLKFAPGECFEDAESAKAFASSLGGKCAVKADGLRKGKGVEICHSIDESDAAIDAEFKTPGAKIVIQHLLEGDEVSLMVVTDGKTVRLWETARDYKRALDGDLGGQTGGVGAYSSKPLLSAVQLAEVGKTIMEPWLAGCEDEGIVFKGVLYIGLMITKEGIFALEFNVRFGDPEAEALFPRLENDFLEVVDACLSGTLNAVNLRFKPIHAICVVMSTKGYPKNPESDKDIFGLEIAARVPNLKVFHYGTRKEGERVLSPQGRTLAVTAWSDQDLLTAARTVYGTIDTNPRFEGAQFRKDIGKSVWGNAKLP